MLSMDDDNDPDCVIAVPGDDSIDARVVELPDLGGPSALLLADGTIIIATVDDRVV